LARARQRAPPDDPVQARRVGRGQRERPRRSRGPVAVGPVAAPRKDARGGPRHLPARKPDTLVPHRRSARRATLRHAAHAVLHARQGEGALRKVEELVMSLPTIKPSEARRLFDSGALLIDIREADEHAREKIPGARHLPLSKLDQADLAVHHGKPVIFHCKSGARTQANARRLAEKLGETCEAFIVEGGLDAWRKAGLPVVS